MIIETKLHIPQNKTTLVPRPRLHKRLHAGLKHKLTLINAPAGYGKTTLLSEWAMSQVCPVAWVSLDQWDRYGLRIWEHTIAALKRAIPSFDDQKIRGFATADPSGKALVAALINGLHRLSGTIVLIWDDFHNIDDPLVLSGVAYLLNRLPVHVHIYISSRTATLKSFENIGDNIAYIEMDAIDLRFDARETADFFQDRQEANLTIQETETILRQTEGWVTGMKLISLSLNRQDAQSRIVQEWNGSHRDISYYFFEEIFSRQSDELQRFMLQTSLLERMQADLCQAVTGLDNCGDHLQSLERSNLFVASLDKQQGWYRYHNLFQEFLQAKLLEKDAERIPALHLGAGDWLETNEWLHEAMEHYLAGRYDDQALNLLEQLAPRLMQYDWHTFERWASQIPATHLIAKPMLFFHYMLVLFMTGQTGEAKHKLAWAFEQLAQVEGALPTDLLEHYRGGLTLLQIVEAYFNKDFDTEIKLAKHFVKTYPNGALLTNAAVEGDWQIPQWAMIDTLGKMKEQADIYRRMLAVWSGTNHYFIEADLCIGYGELMYEWNRLEEAQRYWQQARQLGEAHNNVVIASYAKLYLAKLALACGRWDESELLLDELTDNAYLLPYPSLKARIDVNLAHLRWMGGNMERAFLWFARTELRWTDELQSTMLLDYGLIAHLTAEQGKYDEAEHLLGRLVGQAAHTGRKREQIQLLVQRSMLLSRQGKTDQSLDLLEEALSLAEPDGFLRSFIDAGSTAMLLLQDYLAVRQKRERRQIHQVNIAYIKRLLHYQSFAYRGKEAVFSLSDVRLTPKEAIVLQLLSENLTNKQIADRLAVSLSTVKSHLAHIYDKLQVQNRMVALERAKQLRLFS